MTTVSFRLAEEKKKRIDELASLRERDRSYLINEALDAYLDLMDWQLAHIEESVRQADIGDFATEDEVRATFAKWRSKSA